jgi:4-amino-4-deoxy-L-arabinose transferase-like glycosyltransferase
MMRQGPSPMKRQTISSRGMRSMRPHVDVETGTLRRRWRCLQGAIFGVALLARLVYQTGVVGLSAPPRDDAALYDSIATSLASGGPYVDADGYRSRRAPAYTFLLAGVYAAAGHSWPAARWVQALLGALTCTVLLSLGVSWLGPRVGATAALACAVFPYSIFWTGILVTEPLCALLTTASTWMLTRTGREAGQTAVWSLLCGLTTLTRDADGHKGRWPRGSSRSPWLLGPCETIACTTRSCR